MNLGLLPERFVVELFAGAGGATLGIKAAGADPVIAWEWDADAAATHRAAGFATVEGDVSQVDPAPLAGRVSGLWGSPPCPQFSVAGSGAGNLLTLHLAEAMYRLLAGDDCRREAYSLCYPEVHRFTAEEDARRDPVGGEDRRRGPAWVDDKAEDRTREALLVLEPARWAYALRPSWVACEQVPAVLPLWQAMGGGMEALGYSWWAGVLDAADYGVPQNRKRAIFMARLGARQVMPPEPTHYDQRRSPSMFGKPWVSMAEALGWGMTDEPVPTVTAGGTATGGAEPIAQGGRRKLAAAQEAGGGAWLDR